MSHPRSDRHPVTGGGTRTGVIALAAWTAAGRCCYHRPLDPAEATP